MENVVTYVIGLKDNLSSGVSQATANVSKLDGAVGSVKSSVMSLGSAMGLAFGVAGVSMFVSKVVSAGATVEDATTGLTTLLKDSGEAAQVVKNTMEDATKTPFSFEGLLAGNKALISAGQSAERSREDVLNLANAIAATGGGNDELQRMVINMQQISNTGRASAMDIKQFGFAGINIYQVLADATGKTIDQVKELPVTYDMLTEALKKAAKEGGIYANGLENMSNNVSVKLSNVGDSLFVMFNDIFQGVKPLITYVLENVLNVFNKVRNYLKELNLGDFSTGMINGLNVVKGLMNQIFEPLKGIFNAIFTDTGGWMTYLETIKILFVEDILPVVMQVWNGITDMVSQIIVFVKNSHLLKDIFQIVGFVVGQIWESLGYVFTALKWTFDNVVMPILRSIEYVYRLITFYKEPAKKQTEVVKDVAKSDAVKNAQVAKAKTVIPVKGAKQQAVVGASETPMPKTKAEGAKNINIKIEYNAPLIKGFTISTTNVKQGINSLKEEISAVLTGATHDALLVADY